MPIPNNIVEPPAKSKFWITVQILILGVTFALIAGFLFYPENTLNIQWNILIPILPATFIIAPGLWRNMCPLATLNMMFNKFAKRQTLPLKYVSAAGITGLLLLGILVPARRFMFNENGIALGATVLAVAIIALLLGAVFSRKAGFCNGICPILPVERLYGQSPLFRISNSRCLPCELCTGPRCIDLDPRISIMETIGEGYNSNKWLLTPFGVFAASFPGFVAGYYTIQNVPFSQAGSIYYHIFFWAGVSFLIANIFIRLFRLKTRLALSILAGITVGIYYWFSAPIIATAWSLGSPAEWILRFAIFTLIATWFMRAKSWVKIA